MATLPQAEAEQPDVGLTHDGAPEGLPPDGQGPDRLGVNTTVGHASGAKHVFP